MNYRSDVAHVAQNENKKPCICKGLRICVQLCNCATTSHVYIRAFTMCH